MSNRVWEHRRVGRDLERALKQVQRDPWRPVYMRGEAKGLVAISSEMYNELTGVRGAAR